MDGGLEGAETPAQIVRRARGKFTQEAFAAELGTTRGTVILWEGGHSYPSDKFRPLIAARANVDPETLRRPKVPRLEEAVAQLAESLDEFREQVATNGLQDDAGIPIRPVSDRLAGLEAKHDELVELVRDGFAEIGRRLDELGQQQPAAIPLAARPTRRRKG